VDDLHPDKLGQVCAHDALRDLHLVSEPHLQRLAFKFGVGKPCDHG
jgi:hypothetical protein